jgi:hypothetical protein
VPMFSRLREAAALIHGYFLLVFSFFFISVLLEFHLDTSNRAYRTWKMDSIPIIGSKSDASNLDVEGLLSKLDLGEKIALLSGEQLSGAIFGSAIADLA